MYSLSIVLIFGWSFKDNKNYALIDLQFLYYKKKINKLRIKKLHEK